MKILNNKYQKYLTWLEVYFPFLYFKKSVLDGHDIYLPRWITYRQKQNVDESVKKIMKTFEK